MMMMIQEKEEANERMSKYMQLESEVMKVNSAQL